MYDWKPEGDARSLTLDGRRFWANATRLGWNLSEIDAPSGLVKMIADNIKWSDIDRALQQYIGGN